MHSALLFAHKNHICCQVWERKKKEEIMGAGSGILINPGFKGVCMCARLCGCAAHAPHVLCTHYIRMQNDIFCIAMNSRQKREEINEVQPQSQLTLIYKICLYALKSGVGWWGDGGERGGCGWNAGNSLTTSVQRSGAQARQALNRTHTDNAPRMDGLRAALPVAMHCTTPQTPANHRNPPNAVNENNTKEKM